MRQVDHLPHFFIRYFFLPYYSEHQQIPVVEQKFVFRFLCGEVGLDIGRYYTNIFYQKASPAHPHTSGR